MFGGKQFFSGIGFHSSSKYVFSTEEPSSPDFNDDPRKTSQPKEETFTDITDEVKIYLSFWVEDKIGSATSTHPLHPSI